jgi:hypothetical protein
MLEASDGPVSSTLLAALRTSSVRRASKQTGIHRATLQRLRRLEVDPKLSTVDKLAAHLGLMLVIRPPDPPA